MVDDLEVVLASFAKTYGILPHEQMKMRFSDYCIMLQNLDMDCALFSLIRIRKETNPDEINKFNDTEYEIWLEWRDKSLEFESLDDKKKRIDKMFGA